MRGLEDPAAIKRSLRLRERAKRAGMSAKQITSHNLANPFMCDMAWKVMLNDAKRHGKGVMCRQMQEINRMKRVCMESVGNRNTDVDALYTKLHLLCKDAQAHHFNHCQICQREQAK